MLVQTSLSFAILLLGQRNAEGFTFVQQRSMKFSSTTQLEMGLFDGVKEAFSAAPLERSEIAADRETPIDRWMGWSVTSEKDLQQQQQQAAVDFIDAMDEGNYVAVELTKPMGIVFEENDTEMGGIFVHTIKEGGEADKNGILKLGDQLVAVGTTKVSGLPFEDALNTIVESEGEKAKLVLFRGTAKQFYGPTGASNDWLNEFIAKGGVESSSSSS